MKLPLPLSFMKQLAQSGMLETLDISENFVAQTASLDCRPAWYRFGSTTELGYRSRAPSTISKILFEFF